MAGPATIGSLRVALGLDSAEFSKGAKTAQTTAQKLGKTIQTSVGGGVKAATDTLKGFVSAYLGLAGAQKFLEYADAAKSIDSQLKLATASFGTFGKAQADVNRIANDTRGGLKETASLYGNLVRATQTMGGSQDQAARATETFSKALKIGGADTNAAASATLQFGQALASGVLRGDEFNSIAEASPRILKLIADSLGVSSGALRKMAADGKLSADVLFKALTDKKFTAGIDAEFKTLPVTFGQAMTLVENAAITTFGAFDQGGDFSTALANFITDGSDGFASLSSKAEQFGADTRSVMAGLANVFDPIQTGGFAVFDALGVKIFSVSEQIKSLLGSFDSVGNFAAGVANVINAPGNAIRRARGQTTTTVEGSNLASRYASGQRLSSARSRREASARKLEGRGYIVPRNADGTINEAGIRRRPNAPPPPKTVVGETDADKKKGVAEAKRLAAQQRRAAEKAAADEKRYQDELGHTRSDELAARIDLTVDATKRAQLESEQLQIRSTNDIEQVRLDKDLTEAQKAALIAIMERTSALQQDLIDRRKDQEVAAQALESAQARLSNDQDILQAQVGLARTAKERGRIEKEILDNQFEALKLAQQVIIDNKGKANTPQQIADAEKRLTTLGQLQNYATAKSAKDNQGPLASYLDGLPKSADEVTEAIQGIEANGLSSLIDGLSKVEGGFKGLASTVKNVANEIISSLIKIGLQKGIAALFGNVMGVTTGSGGFNSSSFLNSAGGPTSGGYSFAGARAKGGPVTAGKMYMVGERGPEPFIPNSSGTIIPNDALSGGRGDTNIYQFKINGAVDLATKTEAARFAQAAYDAVIAKQADNARRSR